MRINKVNTVTALNINNALYKVGNTMWPLQFGQQLIDPSYFICEKNGGFNPWLMLDEAFYLLDYLFFFTENS